MSLTLWVNETKMAAAFASNEWEQDWIEYGSPGQIHAWSWADSGFAPIVADIVDALYGDHGDPSIVYATTGVRALEPLVLQGITLSYKRICDRWNNIDGLSLRLESSQGVTLVSVDCSSGSDITFLDEDWSPTDSHTYATVTRGILQLLESELRSLAIAFGY